MLYLLVAEITLVSIAIADYTYYLVLYPRLIVYCLTICLRSKLFSKVKFGQMFILKFYFQ